MKTAPGTIAMAFAPALAFSSSLTLTPAHAAEEGAGAGKGKVDEKMVKRGAPFARSIVRAVTALTLPARSGLR